MSGNRGVCVPAVDTEIDVRARSDDDINRMLRILVNGSWPKDRCGVCGWPLYKFPRDGCTLKSCSMRPAPKVRADAPANYCGDMTAAWTLVERLRDAWKQWADEPSPPPFNDESRPPFNDRIFFESLYRAVGHRWPWTLLYLTPRAVAEASLIALTEIEAFNRLGVNDPALADGGACIATEATPTPSIGLDD